MYTLTQEPLAQLAFTPLEYMEKQDTYMEKVASTLMEPQAFIQLEYIPLVYMEKEDTFTEKVANILMVLQALLALTNILEFMVMPKAMFTMPLTLMNIIMALLAFMANRIFVSQDSMERLSLSKLQRNQL
jgi:hypothetical protein